MDAEINSKPISSDIKYTGRKDEMIFFRSSTHRLEGPMRWYAVNYNIKATEIKQALARSLFSTTAFLTM